MLHTGAEGTSIRTDGETLITALESHPDIPGYGMTFIGPRGEEHYFSYGQMLEEGKRRAAHLTAMGYRKGDRVALMIVEGHEFVLSFIGLVLAGIIPVPISPPMTMKSGETYLATVARIVRDSGAGLLISTEASQSYAEPLQSMLPDGVRLLGAGKIFEGETPPFSQPHIGPEDICFLQYTSGSTSSPKGVMVTHANVMTNCSAFFGPAGFDRRVDEVGLSWLPLYHDMGLIGFILGPLIFPGPVIIIPTSLFARNPLIWLRMIDKYRATITYAPNFAYAHVLKRLKDKDLESLDLSCLRIVGCGGEPISADTLRGFAERLAPVGFRRETFMPSYGMAEATLGVSFYPHDKDIKTILVDAEQLKKGVARPITDNNGRAIELVSCGRAIPDHEIRIVDEDGVTLGDGEVGEITVKGASITRGYYRNPEATEASWRNGWLHTGDQGFILDGELYVCGRTKELIIIRGANYYPQDIEWLIRDLPGIKRGNVAAFSIVEGGEERLIILAEADPRDCDDLKNIIKSVVLESIGIEVYHAVPVQVGTLLRTTSGKLQRRKMKELYENREIVELEPQA